MDAKKKAALALAVALAVPAEGLRQAAYRDPVGILTVCYGHTGGVDPTRKYSLDECKDLLDEDMRAALDAVERCRPGLPAPVLAAFSDAVFNLGPRIACDTRNSTAARMLASGDIKAACEQLTRWDKARVAGVMVALPGLTKRREKERDVCLSGVNINDVGIKPD
jgi:GH24 family phage-related lysozyme (muramidase)